MKLYSRFQYVLFCTGLFLIPAPVFLLCGAATGTGLMPLLPLLAALLCGAGILRLSRRLRLPAVGLSAALCLCLALLMGRRSGEKAWVWASAVLSSLAAAAYPRWLNVLLAGGHSPAMWYTGLAAAGAAWAAARLIPVPGAAGLMLAFTRVYTVWLIFALNLESLREGAGGGRAPSGPMVLKNLAASLGWVCLFLLLTHLPAVLQAVRAAWAALRNAAGAVFAFLSGLFPPLQGGAGPGGAGSLPLMPTDSQPPSPFMQLLERILRGICQVLIIMALAGLLFLAFKGLRRAFRALAARFRAYMNGLNAGFDDQVESLLDWGEIRRGIRGGAQKGRRRPEKVRWDRLSPREQVRRSYQAYLRRHPDIPESRTARQTLQDPAQADIYDAARYSTREITPEEAASILNIRDQ